MTYKQFTNWCNERACDGQWGMKTAILCIDIIEQIRSVPFWKREKEWQNIKDSCDIQNVIEETEKRRKEING